MTADWVATISFNFNERDLVCSNKGPCLVIKLKQVYDNYVQKDTDSSSG